MESEKNMIRPVTIDVFSPPQLACIRSWGRQGFDVGMICIGEEDTRIESKYLKAYVILHPDKCYTQEGISIINEFLEKFQASGITCLSSKLAVWINENRKNLPRHIAIWLPPNNTIKALEPKESQIKIAAKVGFDILPTYFMTKDMNTIHSVPSEHFPICLRPSVPSAVKPTFKVELFYTLKELESFTDSRTKISEPLVAQPFKHLPNLICYGSRSPEGHISPTIAFMVKRKFEGVGWIFRPMPVPTELIDKCLKFIEHFNVTGCWEIEFLLDEKAGRTYFLEINNRFGGHTAKVLRCGYDEPAYCLQSYGVKIKDDKRVKNILVSNKQAILKFLYMNFKGKLTPLDYPDESCFKRSLYALAALIFCPDEVLDWKDLSGSFSLYLQNFGAKFKRFGMLDRFISTFKRILSGKKKINAQF